MIRKNSFLKALTVAVLVIVNSAVPLASQAASTSPIAQIDPSCILLEDGNLDCWGLAIPSGYRETQPQLWLNAPMRTMQVPNRISQISNTCYILIDSTVSCANDKTLVPIGISAISISKGNQYYNPFGNACAVTNTNNVVCWHGDGTTGTFTTPQPVGISNAKQVVVGKDNSGCALLLSGEVQCWGWLGSSTGSSTPTTMVIEPGHLVTSISGAWSTACAITDDKNLWCWGDDSMGQTGQSIPAGSSSAFLFQQPQLVPGISDLKQVSVGQDPLTGGNTWGVGTETCAVTNTGEIYCWGTSTHGAIGTSSGAATSTPQLIQLPGNLSANLIGTNNLQTCAAASDGSLYCWGSFGILSDSNVPALQATSADIPDAPFAPTLSGASYVGGQATASWQGSADASSPAQTAYQMSARFSGATSTIVEMATTSWSRCAVLSDGTVACWGDNFWYGFTPVGKFGTAATRYSDVPVLVPGITNAVQVAIGIDFACALLGDSSVTCWGLNNYGQLGRGASAGGSDYTVNTPAPVIGLPADISQISAREGGICALSQTDGTVLCWGNTARGNFSTPTAVPGVTGAVKISYGNDWTCVVINDGSVQCWGHNSVGTFGDGTPDYSNTPAAVSGLGRVVDVYALDQGACALQVDGFVVCWGRNNENQLGNGTTDDSMTPQLVAGIPRITTLGGSEHGMCAADASIQVYCWGKPGIDFPNPTRVPGLDNSVTFSGGFYTMCGVTQSGTAGCIGDNTAGEMGSGSYKDGGNFTLMTNDVISMCETFSTTCSVPSPPGATGVSIYVQAFNANGVSYVSDAQTLSIAAPNGVTQISNTNLSAAANQSIPLQATSTSVGATISFSSPTPGCAVSANSISSTSPAICEVVATSTSPAVAGVKPLSGVASKLAAPGLSSSHSTKTRFLFVGASQVTPLSISGTNSTTASSMALVTSGGNGAGTVGFFTPTTGCHINGNVLSVAGTAQQTCMVRAKKEGDSTYDSALSPTIGLTLNAPVPMPFSIPIRTAEGFTVNLTNYDNSFTYRSTSSAGVVKQGRAMGKNLPFTVRNLEPGQLSKVTVVASKFGNPDSTYFVVGGSTSRVVTLGNPVPTADGFTVNASKLDSANYNYVPVISGGSGSAAIRFSRVNSALITVSAVTSESAEVLLQQVPKQNDPSLPNAYWSDPSLNPRASAVPLPVVTGSMSAQSKLGDTIFVFGTHLWEATAVYIGGVKAPKITVLADLSIQVGLWPGVKSGAITVQTPSGRATGGNFILAAGKVLPSLTALSSNSVFRGASVEITGSGLGSATAATLGRLIVPFHPVGDGKVVVDIPAGFRSGTYQLQLATTTGVLRAGQITVTSGSVAPTIANGPFSSQSGAAVYVSGNNLAGLTSITLGGVSLNFWAVYGSDLIAIIIPATTPIGTVENLVLTGPGGVATEQLTVTG
jgi:alpha-tubulin suppressor-like RCC1 family protein